MVSAGRYDGGMIRTAARNAVEAFRLAVWMVALFVGMALGALIFCAIIIVVLALVVLAI